MDYLPINLAINNKDCIVIGGGNIAVRKCKQLLAAGAKLTVVAPKIHSELLDLCSANKLKVIKSQYQIKNLSNKFLVIAATNDGHVNQTIYADAEKNGLLVNVVDQPNLCRFIMPSVIDRSPLTIAISSGGSAPVFARMLREKIEWLLPRNIGEFLNKVNKDRPSVAKKYPAISARRKIWESFFERMLGWNARQNISDSAPLELDLDYRVEAKTMGQPEFDSAKLSERTLVLIDLGNGELERLTVATLKALQKADLVQLDKTQYHRYQHLIRRDAVLRLVEENQLDKYSLRSLVEQLNLLENLESYSTVVLQMGHQFEQQQSAIEKLSEESSLTISLIGASRV